MRLSRLHINGFKSFPDRAELGFDRGVTAIVGPNGCGKSNVVDAITWVLGEQSAKSLRGDRMEDVIFNGSDARKPTAAAEVRLKLSHVAQVAMRSLTAPDPLLDDGPIVTRDVEIGRRLYRSGESEYLIDGETCRLRDVHDLLMDSGLGVKAYAVIEQGKIGQILSSRPAERRMLIEEAAGVTKYKSRRRAAELKLEAAQQNLTRIDDIVFEIEKQRGALRRQAARARRYRRLREELRRWEQVQFARRYETLSREIDTADRRLAEARAREGGAAARVAELETALETLRLALTEAEAAATSSREAAHARELEIGRRQQQIEFDRRQIEDLGRQAEAVAVEAAELDGRRAPAHAAIEAQRGAASRAHEALEAVGRVMALREEDYQRGQTAVQGAEHDADMTRAAVLAATSTLSALRQARDNADAVRDRVARERERLDLEHRELTTERARVEHEREAASRALDEARARLDAATAARAGAEAALAAHRVERDAAARATHDRQRDHAGHEARLRSLQEVQTSRATFGDAARFLLHDAGPSVAHHGAVADHLQVDRSFERAVDALLGDLLQHVLVTSPDDATRALALVARESLGRCGLVILEPGVPALEGGAPSLDAGGSADFAPVALAATRRGRTLRSVVHPTGPHAVVLSSLIGDALIVDTVEEAREVARTARVPVATMAGEICRDSWRLEGGARREALGILETRAEAAALSDEVAAGAAALRRMAEEAAAIDAAVGRAEQALSARVDDLHHEAKAIVSIEAQVGRAGADAARLTQRFDVVTTDRRRAAEEERAAADRHDEASRAIDTHAREQRSAEETLNDVLARLHQARDRAEAAMRLVTEARTEQATLVERTAALDADVARLEESARDLDRRLASHRDEIRLAEARREALHQSIRETERLLDDDVRGLDALRDDVRRFDGRVMECRNDFGVREHDIRGARRALELVRAEVTQVEVTRATAGADLSHLAAACLDAVNLTLDEVVVAAARMEQEGELSAPGARLAAASAIDAAEGDADPEDAGDEVRVDPAMDDATLGPDRVIAALKQKIDRLGPVNMMAIEQFDELETRHAFLTTQRKDLLDSISQTGEAIEKIDKTTQERFEEAFAVINRHFETTFTTLFGGGRAGLVLIDQDNDTESGIDIIAQPPGKRLQNVQLLSGGEKALTAMALMFAVFKHRPSPFCLLDEIDAPLDDANIGRFVEMLQGMQTHTQFILITHNRKTMEIADRLYGVTMEEPGVSKLISLEMH